MVRRMVVPVVVSVAVAALSGHAWGIDCEKAGTTSERMICADAELKRLDDALTETYRRAVAALAGDDAAVDALREEERRWLRVSRDPCRERSCLVAAYRLREQELGARIQPGITIDTPLNGWRNSWGETVLYTQEVHYPASSVNAQEDQAESAMIRGRIAARVKARGGMEKPLTLVVNGVPMPLEVDESGAFSRPYAFGSGANGVEVRTEDGSERARVQFFEAYAEKPRPRMRILLSWDTDNTDLDLHVITPDGQHCYYGERVLENGAALDVDVTTGYGPEIFSTPAPQPGAYLVYVNLYGESWDGAEGGDVTVSHVSIVTEENTLDEKMRSYSVPMRFAGDLALVAKFIYP
ncbi:MAG: DUF2135 domain-containing protein [Candidatus Schekmanbacteria bacterium]|nr:DUF2135 domain-containing protein [Candidatus Schekmanbacteria bacterium]